MNSRLCLPVLAVVGVCLWASSLRAATEYAVTDLGRFDRSRSRSLGINDLGQVVGSRYDPGTNTYHAFLWQEGVTTLLPHPDGYECEAADINNAGCIVGEMWSPAEGYHHQACLWQGGLPLPLGTLGGDESCSAAVNELGQIVGCSDVADFYDRGFLWEAGALTNLGPVGNAEPGDVFLCDPYDINAAGRIVGETNYGMGWCAAYMWEDAVTTPLDGLARARGINDLGLVVGDTTGDCHGALWQNGTVTDLGALPACSVSRACDINNSGLIVGSSMEGVMTVDEWACLWRDNAITNLNNLISPDSGWTLQEATAVNEHGWIVGYGRIDGQTHAFLLTPIPEPSVLALISLGVLGLVWVVRRRCAAPFARLAP